MRSYSAPILVATVLLAWFVDDAQAGGPRLTAEQRVVAADWQAFADRVTAEYHVDPVKIVIVDSKVPAVEIDGHGTITIPQGWLQPTNEFVLAHEVAHWVLGHFTRAGYESCRPPHGTQEECEMAANREAVFLLTLGRGMSEREAFQRAYAALAGVRLMIAIGHFRVHAGHNADPCAEIEDLAAQFPQYTPPMKSGCP